MPFQTHTSARFPAFVLSLSGMAGLPLVGLATAALAPSQAIAQNTDSDDASTSRAKRDALLALSKPITLDVTDQPISDLFDFIVDVTGVDLLPIYSTDNASGVGIDPDTLISIKVKEIAGITVLERLLKKAQRIENIGEDYTWQFDDIGSIECGPKSELNRTTRLELYDVADLLFIVPDFDNAPEFDLQQALQTQGGSPFTGSGDDAEEPDTEERAQKISDLLMANVEPDQWITLGGEASITYYGKSFVITAPDYMHRQIAGYNFWPAHLQQSQRIDGKQHMKIKPQTETKKKSTSRPSSTRSRRP